MIKISTVVVVASNDSTQGRSHRPEFQLMMATVLLMTLNCKHQHDVHRIDAKCLPGKPIRIGQPRHITRQTVNDQVDACILPNRGEAMYAKLVIRQQAGDCFRSEEVIVLGNKLPPA